MITIQKNVPVPSDAINPDIGIDGYYRMVLPYPCPVLTVGEHLSPWETVEAIDYLSSGVEVIVRDTAPPVVEW